MVLTLRLISILAIVMRPSKPSAKRATKIHLVVDAHADPIIFILSDGTIHDVKVVLDLVDKINLSQTKTMRVNKSYDSDSLQDHI